MPPKRIAIKNHHSEILLIHRRTIFALGMMGILILILIARLFYLQIVKHDLYTTLSQKNWLDLAPVEPTRGLIYDRNGVLLAENVPVFSLDVIPYKVHNLPQMIAEIGKIIPLSDTDLNQFQKQFKEHRRFEEIPLKLKLSEKDLATFSENQYRFPGVIIKARLLRSYPYGKSLSHILGYVGRINAEELDEIDPVNYSASNYIGKLGIEKFYEDELHGKVGYQQVENDANGAATRVLNHIKTVPGENLYLTIDLNLQLAAEQALAGHRGAVVAIQPSTGQILAMVSAPSFDPNLFVAGISNKDYQTLQSSPDKPLYNRAIRGVYPFASTIKPYLALQGLSTGIANPEFKIFDPGWYDLPNSEHTFYCMHKHGSVNLNKAITCSCDTYFYDLAYKLGIDRMDAILKQFGFGDVTGVDINDELPGVVASPSWKRSVKGVPWFPGDTINSGIGQGFMQATPLQLASAVSTLANRGARFTPYFLYAEQQAGKPSVVQAPTPLPSVTLSNPKYWDIVITAMQNVVTSPLGTGYRFGKNLSYTAAAKTGTAQVYSKKHTGRDEENDHDQLNIAERLRDHRLFIAFAPVDHPQIAIGVITENSAMAVDVARKVMDYYLMPKPAGEKTP